MAKKEQDPNKPLLYRFAEGLRPRLEALRGHKTLTGLLNDVLTEWVKKQEHKTTKP